MNDKDLFNIWSSNKELSNRKNPKEIIAKLKNETSKKSENVMEIIKLKTQKLIFIIGLIIVVTSTITDFERHWEVGYLGFLLIGLMTYIIVSREVLFKSISTMDLVSSLKSKIQVLESYNINYRLFVLMFSSGVVALILYQVLSVLPIGLDLQIECGVIIAILIGAFIYKSRAVNDDYFSAKVEISQLTLILDEITLEKED